VGKREKGENLAGGPRFFSRYVISFSTHPQRAKGAGRKKKSRKNRKPLFWMTAFLPRDVHAAHTKKEIRRKRRSENQFRKAREGEKTRERAGSLPSSVLQWPVQDKLTGKGGGKKEKTLTSTFPFLESPTGEKEMERGGGKGKRWPTDSLQPPSSQFALLGKEREGKEKKKKKNGNPKAALAPSTRDPARKKEGEGKENVQTRGGERQLFSHP